MKTLQALFLTHDFIFCLGHCYAKFCLVSFSCSIMMWNVAIIYYLLFLQQYLLLIIKINLNLMLFDTGYGYCNFQM